MPISASIWSMWTNFATTMKDLKSYVVVKIVRIEGWINVKIGRGSSVEFVENK